MDNLPPDLVFYLVPFLPLATLIAARGVNTRWRYIAQTTSLHPARKVLLDLYLAAIVHPNFPKLVDALWPHVREFDREAYIADLTSRGCILPDLFELWILEWPTKAVHFWAWPGIDKDVLIHHRDYHCWSDQLYETASTVDAIPVPKLEVSHVGNRTCLGLQLWEIYLTLDDAMAQLWLVVDANEKINDRRMGRLIWTFVFHDVDGREMFHRRILSNVPFRADHLIEFLDVLDLSYIDTVDKYYLWGMPVFEPTDA